MDWINLAQDREKSRDLVNAIMNIRVLQNAENFFTSWETVSFSRRTFLNRVKLVTDSYPSVVVYRWLVG